MEVLALSPTLLFLNLTVAGNALATLASVGTLPGAVANFRCKAIDQNWSSDNSKRWTQSQNPVTVKLKRSIGNHRMSGWLTHFRARAGKESDRSNHTLGYTHEYRSRTSPIISVTVTLQGQSVTAVFRICIHTIQQQDNQFVLFTISSILVDNFLGGIKSRLYFVKVIPLSYYTILRAKWSGAKSQLKPHIRAYMTPATVDRNFIGGGGGTKWPQCATQHTKDVCMYKYVKLRISSLLYYILLWRGTWHLSRGV